MTVRRWICLLLFTFPLPARATTMVVMDLPELASTAAAILRGPVVDVRASWSPDRTHIFTYVTVRADEYLKGDLGRDVTLRVFGGEANGVRQVIPGSPEFQIGEEVVLFVSVRGPMFPAVTGLSQGKFTVVRDPETGAKMMTRGTYGASLVGRGDPLQKPLTLDAFEDEVRGALRRARHAEPIGAGRP